MMIKDFIKSMKESFGNGIEFKATSFKDNKTFKSRGYDAEEENIRTVSYTHLTLPTNREV